MRPAGNQTGMADASSPRIEMRQDEMKLSVVSQHHAVALAAAPLAPAEIQSEPLLVLKFGSSVLRSLDDLPTVAGEIYRQRRRGKRIIAVVSALEGETDRLFAEAARASGGVDCSGVAE